MQAVFRFEEAAGSDYLLIPILIGIGLEYEVAQVNGLSSHLDDQNPQERKTEMISSLYELC